MTKQTIDNISYCFDKKLPINTAQCCLNTKVLRYGESKLSVKQIKNIAFQFAHDLIEYAENGGDIENTSAKGVYSFLTDIFDQNNN